MKTLLTSFLLFVMCSCQLQKEVNERKTALKEWMAPNGHIKVLATTAMIGDLVEAIGGEHVDTLVLIQGDLDPHSYQLVKGDNEKLAYANIIFYNGLGLEHGPTLRHYLEDNSQAVSLGAYIQKMRPRDILYYGEEVDPHYWTDIALFKQSIPFIVNILSEKDPIHAEVYRKNGQQLYQIYDDEDDKLYNYLQEIPPAKRYLVTSHDAFNYFAKRYLATPEENENNLWQKRFQAPEGLSPDSQLSSREIQHIIDHLATYNIHTLFTESNLSHDSIRKIVEAGQQKGLQLHIAKDPLYGDAMGPVGSAGDTYLKMMWHNAHVFRQNVETRD